MTQENKRQEADLQQDVLPPEDKLKPEQAPEEKQREEIKKNTVQYLKAIFEGEFYAGESGELKKKAKETNIPEQELHDAVLKSLETARSPVAKNTNEAREGPPEKSLDIQPPAKHSLRDTLVALGERAQKELVGRTLTRQEMRDGKWVTASYTLNSDANGWHLKNSKGGRVEIEEKWKLNLTAKFTGERDRPKNSDKVLLYWEGKEYIVRVIGVSQKGFPEVQMVDCQQNKEACGDDKLYKKYIDNKIQFTNPDQLKVRKPFAVQESPAGNGNTMQPTVEAEGRYALEYQCRTEDLSISAKPTAPAVPAEAVPPASPPAAHAGGSAEAPPPQPAAAAESESAAPSGVGEETAAPEAAESYEDIAQKAIEKMTPKEFAALRKYLGLPKQDSPAAQGAQKTETPAAPSQPLYKRAWQKVKGWLGKVKGWFTREKKTEDRGEEGEEGEKEKETPAAISKEKTPVAPPAVPRRAKASPMSKVEPKKPEEEKPEYVWLDLNTRSQRTIESLQGLPTPLVAWKATDGNFHGTLENPVKAVHRSDKEGTWVKVVACYKQTDHGWVPAKDYWIRLVEEKNEGAPKKATPTQRTETVPGQSQTDKKTTVPAKPQPKTAVPEHAGEKQERNRSESDVQLTGALTEAVVRKCAGKRLQIQKTNGEVIIGEPITILTLRDSKKQVKFARCRVWKPGTNKWEDTGDIILPLENSAGTQPEAPKTTKETISDDIKKTMRSKGYQVLVSGSHVPIEIRGAKFAVVGHKGKGDNAMVFCLSEMGDTEELKASEALPNDSGLLAFLNKK